MHQQFAMDYLYTKTFQLSIESLYEFYVLYTGESNENLKYFLSRNLFNTKGTQ